MAFVKALTARLREKRDYELVLTWMAVFLRVHGEVVVGDEVLVKVLGEWKEVVGAEKERLGSLVGYCAGVVGFLRSGR